MQSYQLQSQVKPLAQWVYVSGLIVNRERLEDEVE